MNLGACTCISERTSQIEQGVGKSYVKVSLTEGILQILLSSMHANTSVLAHGNCKDRHTWQLIAVTSACMPMHAHTHTRLTHKDMHTDRYTYAHKDTDTHTHTHVQAKTCAMHHICHHTLQQLDSASNRLSPPCLTIEHVVYLCTRGRERGEGIGQ